MIKLIVAVLFGGMVFLTGLPSKAQNYEILFGEFDARSLTSDDKRFLQLALAFEGTYQGLLDGAWGRLSQKALDRYALDEYGTPSADWHMAMLAFNFADRYSVDGWNMRLLPGVGMSILVPEKTLIVDAPSANFFNYHHRGSSLAVSYGVLNRAGTNNVHEFTLKQSSASAKPYIVRKDHLAITSASKPDGSTLYTRSNLVNGSWSTVMVSASKWDKNILNAVVASITVGSSGSISISPGGKLDQVIDKAIALGNDPEWNNKKGDRVPQSTVAAPPTQNEGSGTSYGSGFFVSRDGHIVTNSHVVEECTSITAGGQPVALVDQSEVFDLAILKGTSTEHFATFSDEPARLNSDVTAVGFPYAGMLGGLNVTRGSVSAVKGFDNNAVRMQITAPVQTGNSGGPLISSDGSVVGVVVSKLDAVKVAAKLGDLPQNVNYAVRGELAKLFLVQNGVSPMVVPKGSPIAPEALAENAKRFTVFIECARH